MGVKKQTVLIVDDSPDVIAVLNDILKEEYNIKVCKSGEKALEISHNDPTIDLILLDVLMPGIGGFETCRRLKSSDITRNIPVIFVTGNAEIESEVHGLELGAVDYISKPYSPAIIKMRVKTHVMVKNYQASLKYLMEQTLNDLKRENLEKEKSKALYQSLLESIEDSVFLVNDKGEIEHASLSVNEMFGYEIEELLGKPIEMLVPDRIADHISKRNSFFSGAYSNKINRAQRNFNSNGEDIPVFSKNTTVQLSGKLFAKRKDGSEFPVAISLKMIDLENVKKVTAIVQDLTEQQLWENKLTQIAMHDDLTGLANRKYFMQQLNYAMKLSRRMPDENMALIMLDLDFFKPINDTYGHQVGDDVLKHVADIMREQIRDVDTAVRLGGDEFAIVLVSAGKDIKENSRYVSNRILSQIANPFKIDGKKINIGVSIGISFIDNDEMVAEDIIRNADTALYQSKEKGRNCITVYNETMIADKDKT